MPIGNALRFAGLAAAYFAAACVGLGVASIHGTVSPVWPASGLAIGGLTLWGLRLWPAVAIGIFATDILIAGNTLAVAAGIAVGNTLEAVLGAYALRCLQVCGEPRRVRDAVAILAVAMLAPLLSATGGMLSLTLGGFSPWNGFPWAWLIWWIGNSLGTLFVLPPLLAWMGERSATGAPQRPLEFLAVAVLTAILLSFADRHADLLARFDIPFMPLGIFLFPPMVWAVLRLRPRETTLVLALAGALALAETVARSKGTTLGPLLRTQMMLFSIGGGTLLLVGALAESARVRQALEESRERLALALKAGHSGAFSWDSESGLCRWSDELVALYGLESFSGRHEDWLACLLPEDREAADEAVRQGLQHGETELVFRIRRRNGGQVRWMHGRAEVLFDADGRPRQMIGVQMDVTVQRQAEEQVRQQAALLEVVPDPILVWEIDGGIRYWNNGCIQLYGYSAHEALGESPLSLLNTIFPNPQKSWRAELEQTGHWAGELRHTTRDGRELTVETWMRRLTIDGKAAVVAAMRDVTERKRLEGKLRRINAALEERVASRTAELTRANAALERSNLELQQFAFVAAHDLQTPLRSISGFAQLLHKEYQARLDPQAEQWLDQLLKASQRMYDLIHDLLAYARVDSRGTRFQATDMRQLFDDVVANLDAAIRQTGAHVTCGSLPMVMGDRTQLAQVLQNLIDNGIKYRGSEPPQVHVAAWQQDGEWVFSVRDNGIGIPEKHRACIFDIFRRLHTQQEYPGTGVGLAVCRRVIHRHAGRIWVESAGEKGSAFYFTLPER